MKKIPTIFQRERQTRYVYDEVTPGCEWVLNGEGVATRKWDGTCVRITHSWYDGPQVAVEFRREVKPGATPPKFWVEVDSDPLTGKRVGWEPYGNSGFAKFVDEVLGDDPSVGDWPEGTYELIGPKINGNPEQVDGPHQLRRHGAWQVWGWVGRDFASMRTAVTRLSWEGVVFHHPDGRMAKIKRRDFPRPQEDVGS